MSIEGGAGKRMAVIRLKGLMINIIYLYILYMYSYIYAHTKSLLQINHVFFPITYRNWFPLCVYMYRYIYTCAYIMSISKQ